MNTKPSRYALPAGLRCIAAFLIPVHLLTALPVPLMAQAAQPPVPAERPAPVLTPSNVTALKGTREKQGAVTELHFSEVPSDEDLRMARVFPEPLIPMSGEATLRENADLARALEAFKAREDAEDFSALEQFLTLQPTSRWKASLELNMGLVLYEQGYLSRALALWESAWAAAKAEQGQLQASVADRAIGQLLLLNARVGRTEMIEKFLAELGSRDVPGSVAEQVRAAREGLWQMRNRPEVAFKCGPFAVNSIAYRDQAVKGRSAVIEGADSTVKGTNLTQVQKWSQDVGLNLQMAKRSPGASIRVPSVLHWKLDHFAAILREKDGKYLVQDPTFGGGELWISARAIEAESDGYFLIPFGPIPEGWQAIDEEEGKTVWGKGGASVRDENSKTPNVPRNGPCPPAGMAVSSFFTMQATLNIRDTPLFYEPPFGPGMAFSVNYNHLETNQPGSFTFTNTGPNWSFNWLSYLTVDASQNVTLRVRGGGSETYKYSLMDNVTNVFPPDMNSQALLKKTANGIYHRVLPDGSKEIYSQPDGTGRIFLTEIVDPQGNSAFLHYDANFRIDYILDALNQQTNITYKSNSFGNVGYYKIHRITDPFGRYAEFNYDSTTTNLVSITDAVGLVSQFAYDTGTFIHTMTTPYGKTLFYQYAPPQEGTARGLRLTYPDGSKAVIESWIGHELSSHYWNPREIQHHPNDPANLVYDNCETTTWLLDPNGNVMSPVRKSFKRPLENIVNFSYPSQPPGVADPEDPDLTHFYVGVSNKASSIDRILDDGTTHQITTLSYNNFGKVVKSVDPIGRTFEFAYPANETDLLEVRQTRGGDNDLLAKLTYNSQHLPLTRIDGSGQETVYTYNARGQLLTVTNALNETTTLGYDTNGYLTSIDGPLSGSNDTTVIAYDGFGRVDTVTDSEGYVLTYDYDALNRPTKVTYPDTTYQQITWDRLDPALVRDRLGRWTVRQYDAMRRLAAETDPLGRTTVYDWCTCGSLNALVDAAGNRTEWERDLLGRPLVKRYADDTETTYTYENALSRLKTLTDARGETATYTYHTDNTLASVVYSNVVNPTSTASFTYDPDYRRLATAGNGWGIYTYGYNAYITDPYGTPVTGGGQLASITNNVLASSAIAYTYDELGRVVERTVNGSANSVVVDYDGMGRVEDITNPLGTFNYTYQNPTYGVTRLASIVYPNGQTSAFAYYNNAGDQRLQTITHETSGSSQLSAFGYQYNAEGMITAWTQQAGVGTVQRYDLGYDTADQVVTAVLKNNSTNAILKQYYYGYDAAGNRSSEQVDATVQQMGHDNVNQITSRPAGGPVRFQGSISEPGTVKVDGQDATMTSSTTFTANPVLSDGSNLIDVEAKDGSNNTATDTFEVTVSGASGTAPTYDDDGNMLTNGTGQTYAWDAVSRLIKITYSDSTSTEFTHDVFSRRVKEVEKNSGGSTISTKQFIWCGGNQPCEERDGSNTVVKRYYPQGEQVVGASSPADKLFYTWDHLGNIRELTDDNEVVRARYDYDPYGRRTKLTGDLDTVAGYTGHHHHAKSALVLTWYRAYDANLGRFISRDPIGEAGGINLYGYVGSDPINWIDLWGLKPGDRFNSPDAAARDALEYINRKSIKENVEYAGLIYFAYSADGKECGWYATEPQTQGKGDSVSTKGAEFKDGLTSPKPYADYHTHGDYSVRNPDGSISKTGDPNRDHFNSDNFSPADKNNIFENIKNIPGWQSGYLGTPSGKSKKYTPKGGQVDL